MPSLNFNQTTKAYKGTQQLDKIYHGENQIFPLLADPYINNVVLHIKGDGTNNSTAIIDSSPTPKTITRTGSTAISTTKSKYGGSSIYFAGGSSDYLSVLITDFAELWTNVNINYTVEAWINVTNFSVVRGIVDARHTSIEGGEFRIQTTGKIHFYNTSGLILESTLAITANTWNHIALVKNNSVVTLFVNGIASGSRTWANRTVSVSTLRIGGSSSDMLGYIDSLRITKGIARYTANFNPESDTYLAY